MTQFPRFLSMHLFIFACVVNVFANTNDASAYQLEFELVNNGAVIANSSESDRNDTAFPSVILLPDWLATEDRADPSANYYMYYGNHTGNHIRLKWATSIDGNWTDFDIDAGTIDGVFDVLGNDSSRSDYDHISAPDVVIDNVNQQFVMYFHGERNASSPAPRTHERFVTTSGTGLNFNDAISGNGEPGHGPIEVNELTDAGRTRDVWIGDDYMQVFQKDGRFYGVGRRGIINAAPATGDLWAQPTGPNDADPFGEAWERENTPESDWATNTSGPDGSQDQYYSPGASFLASQEFADHPNNPESRRIFSNGGDERLNHVGVNLLSDERVEVFFYVREQRGSSPDDFNAIYRIVYDISDADFQNWTVARDASGQVIFDVVITPAAITAAVIEANGPNFDPEFYADPVSLGDTEIFIDADGEKYLFFSYVSDEFGGNQGEGQITAVRLIGDVDVDVDGGGGGDGVSSDEQTLGNGPAGGARLDGWNSNLVINETDTYSNDSGSAQTILLDSFNFHTRSNASPVTPFVVRVNADNNFTVLAIGTTRTGYSVGSNSLPFSNSASSLVLGAGETLAIGFLDANADGSGSTDAAISYNNGGDEIWYTGSRDTGSGRVAVGQAPTRGPNLITSLRRDYQFTVDFSVTAGGMQQALGNGPTGGDRLDGWNSNLVVNETDTYFNNSGSEQIILLDSFNFQARSNASPVTPFVVRVNADNNFTVLAIGTTRTGYSVGSNSLPFSNSASSLVLGAGETLAIGFLDANADGSGSTDAAISYNNGGDEIWYTGSRDTGSGRVAVGQAPTRGPNLITSLRRDYQFRVDFIVTPFTRTDALMLVVEWLGLGL